MGVASLHPSYRRDTPNQRREGKGPCLADAAHLTFSRRAVRGFGRYAVIRTCSTALSGFLCGGGVIKTSLARDLSPMATERHAPPLAPALSSRIAICRLTITHLAVRAFWAKDAWRKPCRQARLCLAICLAEDWNPRTARPRLAARSTPSTSVLETPFPSYG